MDVFSQVAERIIKEQEKIIGPIALDQARKVSGLSFDLQKHKVTFTGEKKGIIDGLVENYRALFGQASVEVCKDAVKDIISKIPQAQRPQLLR